MNWMLLALTIFFVIFVIATVLWLVSTLGPLRKKQLQRKQEQAEEQRKGSSPH